MKDKKVWYREVATILILVISAFVLFTAVASAADIFVGPSETYTTIQSAVTAANASDTIIVRDGTYTENIDINKRLTIRSENGSENCIVQAVGEHIFNVTADNVNITGFTIEGDSNHCGVRIKDVNNCNISNNIVSGNYQGIWLSNSSQNIILNNTAFSNTNCGIVLRMGSTYNQIIKNNASNNLNYHGIGLWTSSDDNTIANNTANSNIRWGIYLTSSSGNTITNNDCAYNGFSGTSYDGIGLESSDDNTILNNNCSSNAWAGIFLGDYSSNNNVTYNTCSGNHEGIQLRDASYNVFTNNNVSDNDYGIYLEPSSNNNTLTNNTASYNNMKGICLDYSDCNNIADNTVTSNNEDGIFLYESEHCTVINNLVTGHTPGFSFDILVLNGSKLEHQGELSFYNYETLQLPLTHDAGTFTLRLSQHGHDAAYVDYVALKKDDTIYIPISARNGDIDILHKIISPEYDVCDAWNSTLEIRWDNVPEDTTLVMRAMEEDLGEGHGSPLYYPLLREGYTLTHTLVDDGSIHVDGILEEPTEPDFSVFWRPDSPHPDGYTYGWLHSDNQYLYAAVEITADNTPDQEDWGALFVMVDGELREFRISCDETKWGAIGFQYTTSVPYEHRIYEFQIPLTELNAQIGDALYYGFGAYGTVISRYAGITSDYSSNNLISKNKVSDNYYGVYLSYAQWETITENEIKDNSHGIQVEHSDNNTIERNMIVDNKGGGKTGVHVDSGSDENEIHGNCFFDNEPYQAWDDFSAGSSNHWDGNYWEPEPGEPGDPLLIPGAAGSRDNNPLGYCPMCVQAPALTPIGLIALVGLLSALAVLTMRRKRR